ncbi:MAG TPA: hypothetical protein VIH57_05195 [Bacteroidales bacterium]
MKKLSFILIIYALTLHANAQLVAPEGIGKSQNDSSFVKKIDYTFSTGTSFFTSPGYASGSSFYLAPEFKLKLSPKFRVNAGIMLAQNRFNINMPTSLFGEKSVVVKSSPTYDGVAYASGSYSLNSRLTFSGSIIKSFSPDGSYSDNVAWRNSFQMMSLGVDYKLSDHMSIGGGVHFLQSSGFNPYTGYNYMSPGLGFGPLNSFYGPIR